MTKLKALRIHGNDNVAVALEALPAQTSIQVQEQLLTVLQDIPAGHKIALQSIAPGEPIIKYGYAIGLATAPITPGDWTHAHNVQTGLLGLQDYCYEPQATPIKPATTSRTFMGFPRANGTVGIRNELWIIPTVGCVNGIAEVTARQLIAEGLPESINGVRTLPHPFGCSQISEDLDNTRRILANLASHPNAGGVLVLGLGCEFNTMESFKESIPDMDPERVAFLITQDVEDEVEESLALLRPLRDRAAQDQRVPTPLAKLNVGLKCGGSDAFSGLTGNPVVGYASDRLIAHGASTILTEVPEMFGAETILFNRCVNEQVYHDAVTMINDFKQYYLDHNEPVSENPSPGNRHGGLTTLEDKSLGCTQKAGTAPVEDVLQHGQRLRRPGLSLMNGPGNDMIAVTALAGAGCHLTLFTTGRGTPLGAVTPLIKIATRSELATKKKHWIDFDAGPLTRGAQLEDLGEQLFEMIINIASGEHSTNERNGFFDLALWRFGVTL
ncbi:UxaA family hydrolase [Planctomycetota bacterium]